jgi:hypothetical protein
VIATQGGAQTLVDAAEKAKFEGMPLRTRRVQLALQQQIGPQPAAVGVFQSGLHGLHAVAKARLAICAPTEVGNWCPS